MGREVKCENLFLGEDGVSLDHGLILPQQLLSTQAVHDDLPWNYSSPTRHSLVWILRTLQQIKLYLHLNLTAERRLRCRIRRKLMSLLLHPTSGLSFPHLTTWVREQGIFLDGDIFWRYRTLATPQAQDESESDFLSERLNRMEWSYTSNIFSLHVEIVVDVSWPGAGGHMRSMIILFPISCCRPPRCWGSNFPITHRCLSQSGARVMIR